MLLPEFRFIPNAPAIRSEDIIFLICSLIVFVKLIQAYELSAQVMTYLTILVVILIWTLISILENDHILSDYFEIYKLLKFMVILLFCYSFSLEAPENRIHIIGFLYKLFFVILIFNLLNYFDLLTFNDTVMPLYVRGGQIIGEKERLLGTMGNPNDNAIILAYFVIIFFLRMKKDLTIKNISLLAIATILLLMTESRTALVALFISLCVYALVIQRSATGLLTVLAMGGICIVVINFLDLSYMSMLWSAEVDSNDSWSGRVELWEALFRLINESPLLGHGPFKEFLYNNSIFVDSEYVQNALRYGYIGTLLYTSLIICPLGFSFFYTTFFSNVVTLFSVVLLVCGISNAPLNIPQLSVLYACTCGMMYADIVSLASNPVLCDKEIVN